MSFWDLIIICIIGTTMSIKRPMKASPVTDLSVVKFPCYVQPKIDGIRCTVINGVGYSASMKPIRNKYVQKVLSECELNKDKIYDGELIVGNNFQQTSSAIMSEDGEPNFTFIIFDIFDSLRIFHMRLRDLCGHLFISPHLLMSHTKLVNNMEELLKEIADYEECGYEGTMIRSPTAFYKQGRSTVKEQALLKIKKFSDAEALIIGYEEEMHNTNEKVTNELGLSERSSHKGNLVGKGTLGAFIVEFNPSIGKACDVDMEVHCTAMATHKIHFNIGSGFTKEQRKEFWVSRKLLIGKTVKFKYFDYGIKDAPRHPTFLGFRDVEDMTHY